MIQDIRARLKQQSEGGYAAFHQKLIPGAENILGVRTPALRKLAKEIQNGNWRLFLEQCEGQSHEERVLEALVIAQANMEPQERFRRLRGFIPKIETWAVCDLLCSALGSFAKGNAAALWDFLAPYVASPREYEVRFGVVMPLSFINGEYIDRVLALLDTMRHSGYYARMGAAWTLSFCAVHFYDKTFEYLKTDSLDDFTHNKAIQKARESYRVSAGQKQALLALKRAAKKGG